MTGVPAMQRVRDLRGGGLRFCGMLLALAVLVSVAAGAAQYTVDERTSKRLTMVQEFLQAEQYDEAEQILKGFTLVRLNAYERAIVFQMWGYVAAGREDYEAAASYFEKCLAEAALPEESAINMRFNIAQLYMALTRWDDAIAALEQWFAAVEAPNSNAYYTLAIAYYQKAEEDDLPEYKAKALVPAAKAVEIATKPQERWLQLLLALYMESKDYKSSLPVLEQLVSLYPNKSYWIQLSAIYGELGMDQQSLAAQQLAYLQGLLDKDKELRRLAELYLYYELPYRAVKVLEKGFEEGKIEEDKKSLELYANALLAAREYETALEPLERAASLAEDGNLYVRLGQVYVTQEEWQKAQDAFEHALEKGELRNACSSQLLLGITIYNQGKRGPAREWFQRAGRDEACETASQQWIQHLDRERQSELGG
ncbi:MAG: tetratricopeptide repeat protein [Myxococcales bacterium]|nr:tetratricopeptide repeat protein [Myxococcales bacterium]